MKYKKLAASLLGTMMMVTQTLPAYAVQPEKVRVLADEQTAGETVLRASFDGDASDASGRGNNGTIVGSPEFVDGISGKAIHIVNSNGGTMETAKQYVDFGNGNDFKFGTEDFSIKFWTRTPAGGGEGAGLISNKDYSAGGNTGFQIVYFLNGVRSNFRAQGKPRKDVQNIMPLDDHWHEMIINYDRDGMMTIFRDGKQVGQANIADNAGASIDAGNLVVGADGYLHKGISDGYFDELTIVRGLMDTTNARKEYAEGISGYALRQAKSLIEKAEGIGSLNKAVIDAAKEKRSALEALLAAGGDEEVITAAEALVNACDALEAELAKDPLKDATVLQASFDGNADDASGRSNNGTIVGNPEFVEGVYGDAIHIVNSNGGSAETAKQYVDFGNGDDFKFGADDFSLKFWTKTPAGGAEGGSIISNKDYRSGGNTGFQASYFANGCRMNFRADGKGRKDIYNIVPLDDHWHSVIVNVDRAGKMTVFRDGKKVNESNIADSTGASIDAGNLVVGADGFFRKGISEASIDELSVTRGLSDTADARKDYAEGISGYAIKYAKRLIADAEVYTPANPALLDAAKEKLSALENVMESGTSDTKAAAAEALVSAIDALKASMPEYDPELMLSVSFDEENANDESGRGNNGTIHGTPVFEEGISGKAIRLANTAYGTETVAEQYVDFGNKDDFKFGTNDYSFSLWYKENKDNQECAIFGNKDWTTGANVGWNLGIIGSGLRMNFTPEGTDRQDYTYGFLNDAKWHHLAVNVDRDGLMSVYVDGAQSGTKDISAYADKSIDALGLVLGADANGLYGLQDATIDEITMYNRVMSVEEIQKQQRAGALVVAIAEARELIKDDTSKRAENYGAAIDKIEARFDKGEDVDQLFVDLSLAEEAYTDTFKDPLIVFNVMSDTHIGAPLTNPQAKNLKDAVDDIEYFSPNSSALMIPGDLTDGGSAEQFDLFFDIMKSSSAHPIVALGNHDVRWLCSGENRNPETGMQIPTCIEGTSPFADRYLKGNRQFMPEDTPEGQLYFDQWINGYHFITLNTEKDLKDQAYISDAQLDWLEQVLEGSEPGKPIFMQIHQCFEGTSDYHEGDLIGGEAEVRLKEILKNYPQSVIFTGHTHSGKDLVGVYDREFGHTVDTPCFFYQTHGDKQAQIGYQVYVYEDDIIVRQRDFANNVWLDDYNFHINLDAKDPTSDAYDIPLEGLSATAGSEQSTTGSEGPVSNLFDNDTTTKWHTKYGAGSTTMADRWVQVDLGKNDLVTGVRYLPRKDGGSNGNLLAGEIQISKDGENWTTATEFTWKDNATWKNASFAPTEARYVRVVPTKTHGESGSGAELRITHAVFSEREKLETALSEARAIEGDLYTEESFAALNAAIQAAQSILDKEDARDEDFIAAREALNAAIEALETANPEHPIRLGILDFILNFAKTLNSVEFLDEDGSFTRFEGTRDNAQSVKDNPADQNAVDTAAGDLNDDLLKLRRKPDPEYLEKLLSELNK